MVTDLHPAPELSSSVPSWRPGRDVVRPVGVAGYRSIPRWSRAEADPEGGQHPTSVLCCKVLNAAFATGAVKRETILPLCLAKVLIKRHPPRMCRSAWLYSAFGWQGIESSKQSTQFSSNKCFRAARPRWSNIRELLSEIPSAEETSRCVNPAMS